MRRRSERKKSSDSPAQPASRRSNRRSRKSPDVEKSVSVEDNLHKQEEDNASSYERTSSDERNTPSSRKSRSSRKGTPLNDCRVPTKKVRGHRERSSSQQKVEPIPEENENGSFNENIDIKKIASYDGMEKSPKKQEVKNEITEGEDGVKDGSVEEEPIGDEDVQDANVDDDDDADNAERNSTPNQDKANREVTVAPSSSFSSKAIKDDELKRTDILDIQTEDMDRDVTLDAKGEPTNKVDKQKEKSTSEPTTKNRQQRQNVSIEEDDERKSALPHHKDDKDIEVHHENKVSLKNTHDEQKENLKHVHSPTPDSKRVTENRINNNDTDKNQQLLRNIKETEIEKYINNDVTAATAVVALQRSGRKRKWITKKPDQRNAPILAISTDSLKNIIADVQPVPLSDVQLETSSEEEGVITDREEDEHSATPPERVVVTPTIDAKKVDRVEKHLRRKESLVEHEKIEKTIHNDKLIVGNVIVTGGNSGVGVSGGSCGGGSSGSSASASGTGGAKATVNATATRSPSPARNQTSTVLYITNLVRPFTVLQLKGLLARTGKIVEDGFWIDRIKSKCYVEYETEDEAIETRHALHGVRWPISNPKFLNVDFGSKADMQRVIQSTKDELPKLGQDNNRDNQRDTGGSWSRNEVDEKKGVRPVREWDVGKKENIEQEKGIRNDRERRRSKERAKSRSRENNIRSDRERKRRSRSRERALRSHSISPVRKVAKKENDPPIRLLDDLFRKTKATPCIYWLPLTPEQIAEKELQRQKRIEEHKQRVKERELEREKQRERERERERNRERDRDRERDSRRNRSIERDRRRSRSRDRRRY